MKKNHSSALSIILPTLNEAQNISILIDAIIKTLPEGWNLELVIVDDNSSDGTSDIVSSKIKVLASDKIQIKIIQNLSKKGLGNSILQGIKSSSNDLIAVMDADFTHPPKYIPELIEQSSSYSIVIGSRYVNGGNMIDKKLYYSSKIYNKFLKIFLKMNTNDLLGGFFIMKKHKVQEFLNDEIFTGYGDYFLWFIYGIEKLSKLNYIEIPVTFDIRQRGESKSNRLTMFFTYFYSAMKCKKYFSKDFVKS